MCINDLNIFRFMLKLKDVYLHSKDHNNKIGFTNKTINIVNPNMF